MDACFEQREVELTTTGRRSGGPQRVVIWVSPGQPGRLYIRSGGGLGRNWTRNISKLNEATLHLDGCDVPVTLRHIDEPAEARLVTGFVRAKYGDGVRGSMEGESLTPGEEASFELLAR